MDVFEVLDAGRPALRVNHGDEIEPARATVQRAPPHERSGRLFNARPLGRLYGVDRVLHVLTRSRLDLDEHERVSVGTDQVDFAAQIAEVPADHPQAAAFEVPDGCPLAAGAEPKVPSRRLPWRARPKPQEPSC